MTIDPADLEPREVVGMDGVRRLIQYNADGERVRCEVIQGRTPARALELVEAQEPPPRPPPAIPASLFG